MGFLSARFAKSVDPNLICGICSGVLEAAISTPCGHTFCESCINTWLDTANVSTCPECRSRTDKASVRPVLALRNLILSLEASCPNKLRGCDELITLESQDAHLIECPHVAVVCDDCKAIVDRNQLSKHQEKCLVLQSTKIQQEEEARVQKSSNSSLSLLRDIDVNNEEREFQYKTLRSNPRTLSRLHLVENGPAQFTYLLRRINSLERRVGRLLDVLHEANRNNSSLYCQNRHLKLKESPMDIRDRNRKEISMANDVNDFRFEIPFDYSVSCPQDIGKLSLKIARYLLHKPGSVNSDRVFGAIRKCYEMQFQPTGTDSSFDLDIHMLLATAYSSNWFTGAQRILLGCWLQCVLKNQDANVLHA